MLYEDQIIVFTYDPKAMDQCIICVEFEILTNSRVASADVILIVVKQINLPLQVIQST